RAPARGGRISTGPQAWTDYEVDVVVDNPATLVTYVRYQDARSNSSLWMRPWRHLDFNFASKMTNQQLESRSGILRLSAIQTVRAMFERLLRPYPIILLVTVMLILAGWLGRRLRPPTDGLVALEPSQHAIPGWQQHRLVVPAMLSTVTLLTGGAL